MSENRFLSILRYARTGGFASAAINILNYNTAEAVVEAAKRVGRPVILQPSVGTVKRFGVFETKMMVDAVRHGYEENVALHLDHCRDEALAKACVDAGWDAVMMDFSHKPLDENIVLTRSVVEYAHLQGVAVEGEVGVILGVEEDISAHETMPVSYEETIRFIGESGVDAIAPAIGTAHGLYTTAPQLNFSLVEKLGEGNVPVVVHGGTGLTVNDFHKLIRLGVAKINISTALKQIYLQACRETLEDIKINPIDFDRRAEDRVSAEMEKYIRAFNGEAAEI